MSDLLNYIKENKKIQSSEFGQKIMKNLEGEEVRESDEDKELRIQFAKYREAESKGNLLKIPYETWDNIPETGKVFIKENLDPIIWGSVYVMFSEFSKNARKILQHMTDECDFCIYPEIKCHILLHQSNHSGFIKSPEILKIVTSKSPVVIFKSENGKVYATKP